MSVLLSSPLYTLKPPLFHTFFLCSLQQTNPSSFPVFSYRLLALSFIRRIQKLHTNVDQRQNTFILLGSYVIPVSLTFCFLARPVCPHCLQILRGVNARTTETQSVKPTEWPIRFWTWGAAISPTTKPTWKERLCLRLSWAKLILTEQIYRKWSCPKLMPWGRASEVSWLAPITTESWMDLLYR